MNTYQPPFTITPKILDLVSQISEAVTKLEFLELRNITPLLRKANKIKTITGTPFIEFMLEAILITCKKVLEKTQNVPIIVPKNVPLKRLDQIIGFMKENRDVTIEQLAQLCDVSSKTVKRDIAKLKDEGRVERVGSLKSGYWEVRS